MDCVIELGSKTGKRIETQSKSCLTTEHIHQFYQDGFTVVRGFASTSDLEQIYELLTNLFAQINQPQQRVYCGCLQQERRLVTTHYFKKLQGIAKQLLGSAARLRYDQVFYKQPYSNWSTEWHQDEAFAQKNSGPSLKASFWLALQDVTVESGCLQYIPGSHKGQLLPHYPLAAAPSSPLATLHVDTNQAVPCQIKAGDITIHHGRTLHYAGPNITDRPRLAWTVEFAVGGSSPRAQLIRLAAPIRKLIGG